MSSQDADKSGAKPRQAAAAAFLPQEGWAGDVLPRGRRWFLLTCVFALSWLPYLPALSQGWVDWDDNFNFTTNPNWHGFSKQNLDWMWSTTFLGHYQPLSWLSFALEYTLWGPSPERMHLVNVLLHALNAVLLARLVTRLIAWSSGARPGGESMSAWLGGAAAALLFSMHPLRVESVAWATERRDVLSTLFLLSCLLCWLRTKDGSSNRALWWILALAWYACSLLSKAWGMTLPALLVALELYPLRTAAPNFRGFLRSALSTWPFVPFALLCAWKAMGAQAEIGAAVSWAEHPLSKRLVQSAWGAAFYLWKTLVPVGLSPLYELEEHFDPWERGYVIAVVAVIVITAVLAIVRKRFPAGLAAWIMFLIIASPVLGLFQSGAQKAADRYTYLACMPFAALAGAGIALLVSRRSRRGSRDPLLVASAVGFAAIVVALGLAGFRQTKVWKNSESISRQIIKVEPKSYIAHHNLAVAVGETGREAEAIDLEKRCIELSPGKGNMAARNYLATMQMRMSGKSPEQREHWLEESFQTLLAAFHVDPEEPNVLGQLDQALTRRGERARLYTLFEEEIAKDPRRLGLRCIYAQRLLADQRAAEAEAQYKAALAVDPGYVPAMLGLGRVLVSSRRLEEAEPLLTGAMRRNPYNPEAFAELGGLRAAQGRMEDAELLFQQALAYDPNHLRTNELIRQYAQGVPGSRR
ncbi:MAG TPA: tetratricopeptide repeat protein [Planctomycetota bacterium]|nr:tetratricopeptide repeat protein [Planctomycetota bacterium]